ncbi:carboxylesterase family protein [Schlegelella sp. S2-27]|uniref:Carboxylic ester hydrolase n=2 Tax=Caldimonas mangrovi TaxID=2944811 RepID=A0ABT0YJG7_9BURK|nr:carboxylesterase family protein [Caldimonas mangrovi]MCM5678286.1 carboxylesterase family protein [Caldimonas mangrovi]
MSACGGNNDEHLPSPLERQTRLGKLAGLDEASSGGTYAWLGVPYAKPPVGDLRWKAPMTPDAWSGVREAKAFGNACIQNGRIYGPGTNNTYDATIGTSLNTPVGSEDCLTLNIWRPASSEPDLPVLFFIYGGSNISGYTADPVYHGAKLAKAANAVVVTVNYRLGPFGFFNLAQLKTTASGGTSTDPDGDSGNFALLDLIQALKFVQDNIAAFGGNASNVTVMGQSAGAINTWALLASPKAVGLFHKAVPLSGGISLAGNLPPGTVPMLNPAATYATQANALLAQLMVADGTAADLSAATDHIAALAPQQVADYLRGKSAATILTTLSTKGLTGSGPIPEGTVLPTDPTAAIAAGNYNKVPVLAGNTADEGKLFGSFLALSPVLGGKPGFIMNDATRFAVMADAAQAAATTIDQVIDPSYLPVDAAGTGWNARTATLNAVFMVPSRDNVLDTLKSQQADVWYYHFKWAQQPAPWNDIYGAAHAFDLPFLFGNFGPSLFANVVNSAANDPGRRALSASMMRTLGAFMRTGDPNNASLGVTWAPWPARLHFDASLTRQQISVQ